MCPTDLYKAVTRRYRRGFMLFRVLFNVSMICLGCSYFLVSPWLPWAAFACLAGVLFLKASSNSASDYALADAICRGPALVYWVQPVSMPAATRHRNVFPGLLSGMRIYDKKTEESYRMAAGATGLWEFVQLHLRDGNHLEVRLSTPQMRELIAWLTEMNPSLRVGDFYDVPVRSL